MPRTKVRKSLRHHAQDIGSGLPNGAADIADIFTTVDHAYVAALSYISLNGPDVSQWDDSIGSDDLAEAIEQPFWDALGGPRSTGQIVFDGVTEHLSLTFASTYAEGSRVGMFVVGNYNNATPPAIGRMTLIRASGGSIGLDFRQHDDGTNRITGRADENPDVVVTKSESTTTATKLWERHHLPTGLLDVIKGAETVDAATAGIGTDGNGAVSDFGVGSDPGGGSPCDCSVSEIVILGASASSAQRTVYREDRIAVRYGEGIAD